MFAAGRDGPSLALRLITLAASRDRYVQGRLATWLGEVATLLGELGTDDDELNGVPFVALLFAVMREAGWRGRFDGATRSELLAASALVGSGAPDQVRRAVERTLAARGAGDGSPAEGRSPRR